MLPGLLHTAICARLSRRACRTKRTPPEAIRQGQDLVVAGRKSVRHGRGRVRQIVTFCISAWMFTWLSAPTGRKTCTSEAF
jgi:hypothetical protein